MVMRWEVKDMSINRAQLYQIKKAKARKTRVIVAAINREIGQGESTIISRIVKSRINKELHLKYGITKMEDLPERDYERVLAIIKNYRFYYCGKYYG